MKMNLIDKLCSEAKSVGMSYGQYVATLNREQELAFTPKKQIEKKGVKCKVCGEFFKPEKTKRGYVSKSRTCPKCIELKHQKAEEEKKTKRHRTMKERIANCTRCGTEIITTQPHREGCNLYCRTCKVEVAAEKSKARRKNSADVRV